MWPQQAAVEGEAEQEAQREGDLSQPKAGPDTDHAGKHVSPFCWDLY